MCKLFYVLKINCQENALLNIISHSANTVFVIIHGVIHGASVVRGTFVSFQAIGKFISSHKNKTPCFFTLLGTVMTPNYIDSSSLSVAPWCDCNNSGNDLEECLKFLNFFKDNTCLSEFEKTYNSHTDVFP